MDSCIVQCSGLHWVQIQCWGSPSLPKQIIFRCASISCFQVVSKWVTKWLILFQIFSIYSLNSLYSLKSLQFVHSLHSLHSLKSIYIQYSWYLNTIKKVNTVNSVDSILALDQKRFSRWTDIFFYSLSVTNKIWYVKGSRYSIQNQSNCRHICTWFQIIEF